MKAIKFLVLYSVILILVVSGAIFLQPNASKQKLDNSVAPIAKNSLVNQDLVFAILNGKKYSVGDMLGSDSQKMEEAILSFLETKLKQLIKKEYVNSFSEDALAISSSEITKFYNDNNLKSHGKSLEEYSAEIETYLTEQKGTRIVSQIIEQAKANNQLEVFYHSQKSLIRFTNFSKALLGNKSSKVALIEFSDLQCPFCARVQPVIDQLVKNYGADVGFYFRHFPISSIHKQAFIASTALECSIDQGIYHEYKSLLFDNQDKLMPEDLFFYASKIQSINLERLKNCVNQGEKNAKINRDINQGKELGINGTPSFFIGRIDSETGNFEGELISGAQTYGKFAVKLDYYLANHSITN